MLVNETYSFEEKNLFNPAYVGTIIYQAIREHQKKADAGLHCALVYLLVPLVLSPRYLSTLPSSISSPLESWVINQEGNLIGFPESVKSYVDIVNYAVAYLISHDAILLGEDGLYQISNDRVAKMPVLVKDTPSFKKSFLAAGFIGRWFSCASSVESVFIHFGVKP